MADTAPQQLSGESTSGFSIHTIPMEFYGGKNPDPVEFGVQKQTTSTLPTSSAPAARVQPVVVPLSAQKPGGLVRPANVGRQAPKNTSLYVAIGLGVLLLAGVTIASYWWFIIRPAANNQVAMPLPPPVVFTTPTTTPEVLPEPEIIVPTSTLEIATSTEPVIIPNHSFVDSEDGDDDELTDVEEELWGTNGALADSDADGFGDRVELLNLYNPKGVAPQRLIDANLVNTYVNPEYGYQLYYPNAWLPSSLSSDKKEMIFTSITQEFVQVTALPFPTDAPFVQWFAKTFPNERLGLYVPFVNRFKVSGVMSEDGAVAIITDGSHVYILTYNGGVRETINYRTTFKMMVQSFKTANVTTPIDLLPSTISPISLPLPAAAMPSDTTTSSTASSTADINPDDVVFVTSTAGLGSTPAAPESSVAPSSTPSAAQ